jgi:DNA-binding transcriptional ArsR family regulator
VAVPANGSDASDGEPPLLASDPTKIAGRAALTWVSVRGNLRLVMTNAMAMLTALGDPTRQAILEQLVNGPLAVGQLAERLPVTRPAVSQHLRVLKDVGLVVDRQVGTRRLYQADPYALAALRAHLDGFWERSLAAFQDRTREVGNEHD